MKARAIVSKTVEFEIDDKFRALAISDTDRICNDAPEELYQECMIAVTKATGIPYVDLFENYEELHKSEGTTGVIIAVDSLENGYSILYTP